MFNLFNKPVRHRAHKVKNSKNSMAKKMCNIDGKSFCKPTDKPLKPIIARAGGKTKLLPKILPRIPKHKVYVEPFVGGGAVFLKKPLSEKSVINDKEKNVVKVYKAMKNSPSTINKCNNRPSKAKFNKIT